MNRKQLAMSLVVLTAIGLSIYFIFKKDSSTWNSSKYSASGDKLLPDLDVNKVTAFTISSGKLAATVRKNEDGTWSVSEKESYPGDYQKISNFLTILTEIKTVQNINAGKSQLEKLNLGEADKEKGTAVLVELSGGTGKNPCSLLLGKGHFKKEENPNPYFGGAAPDGRYTMVCDGKFQPRLINQPLEDASADPLVWTDKSLFVMDAIKTIEVLRGKPEGNWKMIKDEKSGKLVLPDVKEDEILDESKIQPLNTFFKNISFKDVAQCPANFAGDSVNIETVDGFKYEIKFASKEGDSEKYLVNVKVSASLPEKREAGKEEKPEDKDRLDKEFKSKTDMLKEKLEHEKSLGKWLYTMAKNDLAPVLKVRKDFLKAQEGKKPEAPKNAAPERTTDAGAAMEE
ncbi:MAG TPA: hypothetical protein DET40_11225 [Lentisphaeria bacterium]|nr:MAG: hypothetical protein A2X45_19965 [Lentisphaerae bacterium GWF2_50_93]HCE44110.1 hypothetical protein [Lentisphaeria bacterium]